MLILVKVVRPEICSMVSPIYRRGSCAYWCVGSSATPPSCERRIFAERLDDLASPYARRTQRLTKELAELGFVLGGKAGAQLAAAFSMSGSCETILRIVRSTVMPAASTPRILGVDEWAFRRAKRYGTLLVDLELWLTAAFHAAIPAFRPFVRKLRQDQMAVQAGLMLKWSNGPVEGQIKGKLR